MTSFTIQFQAGGSCIVALAAIFVLSACYILNRRRRRRPTRLTSIASIQALLQIPHTTHRALLKRRAIPNERLVSAFQITNSFVTADLDVHKQFRARAARPIELTDWFVFQDVVSAAIQEYITRDISDYATTVRSITLVVVILGLLDVHGGRAPSDLDKRDVVTITKNITRLWILSKSSLSDNDILNETNAALQRLLPTEANPLNIVIPSWETLWRVVAALISHVHDDDVAWHMFADFFEQPNREQFVSNGTNGSPSVQAYVMEGLRLYPPTKRIARADITDSGPGCTAQVNIVLADIESLLHSPRIFSSNADTFEPSRQKHRTRDQEDSMRLIFGYGFGSCPAQQWAPMAAGLIVAGILNGGCEVHRGEGSVVGGREGWDGWKISKKV